MSNSNADWVRETEEEWVLIYEVAQEMSGKAEPEIEDLRAAKFAIERSRA